MNSNGWKRCKLGNVLNFRRGHDLSKKNMVYGIYPVVGSNGVIGYHNEYTTNSPCLTVGRSGNIGIPHFLKQKCWAHNTTLYIDDFKGNNPEYIYYLLKILKLGLYGGGSAVPTLNRNHIHPIEINYTENRSEQKAIAHILSTLDKEIEINNQINKKLEEMAQAIFKQWFVDFEFPCLPKNYKFSGAGKPDDYDKVLTYKRVGGLPIPDGKSWFVYVLLCDDGSFYKGMTNDLYRRFYEHYTGIGAEWTKIHKPVKVIHYEKFNSQQEARKREEELKSGYGREWIKREYKKYQEGLPAHQTRLMMAGEMVESEMGMIPKGWEIKLLGEVLNTIEAGNRPKGGAGNLTEGIPSIGAENIIGLGEYDYSKEKFVPEDYFKNMNKGIIKSGDVLLYKDGAKLGRKSMFMNGFPYERCCVNSHVFILRANDIISQNYLYFWLDQDYMTQNIVNLNANSAQPGINQMQVKSLKILVPNNSIVNKFDVISSSLLKKIFLNCNVNNNLTKLRDTLLPKLMSGEIRVPLKD